MNKFFTILFLILIFLINIAPIKTEEKNNKDLSNLIKLLNKKGFKIKNELPPIKEAYGLFENSTKTIWISPITNKLGIYKNVLVHEAVHAAQSCPRRFLTKLNIPIKLNSSQEKIIKMKLVNHYNHRNFLLEKEAFSIQTLPNSVEIVSKEINKRCL